MEQDLCETGEVSQQPRRYYGSGDGSSKINGRQEGGSGVHLDVAAAVDAQQDDEVGTDGGNANQSNCAECLKSFQVMENFLQYVIGDDDEVRTVLTDCGNKFKPFMAHQFRCRVQQFVKNAANLVMEQSEPEMFPIDTMNYKMNYEPKWFGQKLSHWYCRKGMSWHGTVVKYRARQARDRIVGDRPRGRKNRSVKLKLYIWIMCAKMIETKSHLMWHSL